MSASPSIVCNRDPHLPYLEKVLLTRLRIWRSQTVTPSTHRLPLLRVFVVANCRSRLKSAAKCDHYQRRGIRWSRQTRLLAVRSLVRPFAPFITDNCELDDELLNRRRLGKTKLQVKPGQVGTSNATKAENLGPFEYAHLRAPLPDNLKGSEIFPSHQTQPPPETYFLMVR